MRLFVAVDLDEPARQAAAGLSRRLRRHCESAGREAVRAVKWVDPGNLHVTLHFIGEVHDDRLPAITAALVSGAPGDISDLSLGGVCVFPPTGPPRVVCIGVTAGHEYLSSIHRDVGRCLSGLGLPLDTRAFAPHVTVARIRATAGSGLRTLLAGMAPEAPFAWRVDHVTLYCSHLSSAGPRYDALLRVPLTP